MELKEKTIHTILNEIIEAAKECGQVMLQADRTNFGIKDKAGKANFVTKYDCKIQEMLERKLSEILPKAGGVVTTVEGGELPCLEKSSILARNKQQF